MHTYTHVYAHTCTCPQFIYIYVNYVAYMNIRSEYSWALAGARGTVWVQYSYAGQIWVSKWHDDMMAEYNK